MTRIAGFVLLLSFGCSSDAARIEALGGKPPIACITSIGSGSDENCFTTCRDAAGVVFVCNRDKTPHCIRVQSVQAVWSAGLPEARP